MLRAVAGGLSQAAADAAYAAKNAVNNVSPTTGQTVPAASSSVDQTLYITPAGTLATLTIGFPSDASSRIGQILRIVTTQAITLMTLNGATIVNGIVAMASGDHVAFQKVLTNTWVQI